MVVNDDEAMIVVVLVVIVSVSGGDECRYGCSIKTNLLVVSMPSIHCS